MTEGIILIHGIFRTNSCMKKIARLFENKNYKTLNIEFPSTKYDILSLAKIIHQEVKEFAQQVTKIHFIGHSIGGLIIRTYLNIYSLENLGRVVMLGTPNNGSEIADFLKDFYLYKKLYGPAGQQLITDQSKFKNIFGSINYELGVIAGISSFHFIANKIIGKESDGRVSVISTKVEGMKDHITIKSTHVGLTSNKEAWQFTKNFIETGNFNYKKL